MNLRRCAPQRENQLVHLFYEGAAMTLCDREIGDSWVTKGNDAIPSCHRCVLAYDRLLKAKPEEQAS